MKEKRFACEKGLCTVEYFFLHDLLFSLNRRETHFEPLFLELETKRK